ncbi:hypothetical protein [Kineosporia sp. NBRC 101731]|uniref:hypothetical protein n=1 Tax=Kineosporia sp. NBRC 101731 TaxID=3032199 RepID=UPI0024A425F8|nr:hypothetical protein [Kineosporia sp. NBRC 101731]GLY33403.1 hypothetical protein Kisp02_67680 [Kineosporia sp. NBRC 101731]
MNAAHPHTSTQAANIEALPDLISHVQMRQALDRDTARHLAPLITDFINHVNHWWITSPDGWLRIDDARLTDTLNRQHQRFNHGLYEGPE